MMNNMQFMKPVSFMPDMCYPVQEIIHKGPDTYYKEQPGQPYYCISQKEISDHTPFFNQFSSR
jgi:hypothetical protein